MNDIKNISKFNILTNNIVKYICNFNDYNYYNYYWYKEIKRNSEFINIDDQILHDIDIIRTNGFIELTNEDKNMYITKWLNTLYKIKNMIYIWIGILYILCNNINEKDIKQYEIYIKK